MDELEIKIKELTPGCMPTVLENGDWIDLHAAVDVDLQPGERTKIPLGVAMELPKGYEAYVLPRSSTAIKYGILLANSQGVIDNSYCGDGDEWSFLALAFEPCSIAKGTRIAQFRIVKNQPPVKLTKVDTLGNENRGGYGSTGV